MSQSLEGPRQRFGDGVDAEVLAYVVGIGSMDLVSLFVHKREASTSMGLYLALDRTWSKALLIVAITEL
jgi:hypothetical protein